MIINKIRFFTNGHERTLRAKKNIFFSFLFRGLNILIGILLVPIVLNFLDQTRYGIWLTMVSFVSWFNLLDIGMGHGLRNKLSEALAVSNFELSAKYVSTSYALLSLISSAFLIVFFIIDNFISWSKVLNTTAVSEKELNMLAITVFLFFGLNLTLKLINSVISAYQQPALNELISLLGKSLIFLLIFFLYKLKTKVSLLSIGIIYSVIPFFVLFYFSLFLYFSRFKAVFPRPAKIDLSVSKDILSLGGKFFVIQIAVLVLFSTDNIIISQLFSPAKVTPYQIAGRYFGMVTTFFVIIVSPFWSASTEAFVKKDYQWVKNVIKKLFLMWFFAVFVVVIMLFGSKFVYALWIGNAVHIPFSVSLGWALFVIINMVGAIITQFINGSGKIRVSLYTAVTNMIINIPLSIFLAKNLKFGISGIILATTICIIISIVIRYIQLNKIINNKDFGLWGR